MAKQESSYWASGSNSIKSFEIACFFGPKTNACFPSLAAEDTDWQASQDDTSPVSAPPFFEQVYHGIFGLKKAGRSGHGDCKGEVGQMEFSDFRHFFHNGLGLVWCEMLMFGDRGMKKRHISWWCECGFSSYGFEGL